ncbi:FAD-dependent monooxygenase [Shimia biformata]|uniref:FAD-dependent monooxygenase n=1 Tax=Shimia biformata TaxID=1294299 RepID=UPI001952741C|nr:FAD-dependent monooxygenase [Shimia biformata]
MDLNATKVTIIGAGIGGLTAAIALCRRGADVTVLEQSDAITEVGAGIQVSPNGIAVLRALGLEDALRVQAVQARAIELRNHADARLVARLDLGLLPADQPYFFVHRADLIDILAGAAREAGVKIRLLQKVDTIEPGPHPVVRLENGDAIASDLVVGADGLHSRLRPVLNGTLAPFFTRQTAWRATVPNGFGHPNLTRVHMGPKSHIVSYPLRQGKLVNIVAVREEVDWVEESWSHQDDPAHLRLAFSHYSAEVREMLKRVETVGYWGLFRHPVAKVWHRDNTVLLGDAAHPTLPFMAQGAVMAMEDAWVLADALGTAPSIDSGLASYQSRREDRVRKVVETANGNAWKYHLSFPPMRFAAHLGMRVLSTVAPKRLLTQFDWIYRHDVTRDGG